MMDKRKRKQAEAEEKLDVLGQESEHKAVKWIKEESKEKEKKDKKIETDRLTILDDAKNRNKIYRQYLCQLLHDMVLSIKMTTLYQWGVWFDGKGIRLAIQDKYNKLHVRAFIISYSPEHDLNVIARFAMWAEDIYDKAEGNLAEDHTDSGLWIPKTQKTKQN